METPFFRDKKKDRDDGNILALLRKGRTDPVFNEQFKALRAKLEYKIEMLKCKVLAVTSAIAGEGKTLLCTNLAINLTAGGKKKVLLVDMDLRKSDLARSLNIPSLPGLSEYLVSSVTVKDIVRNSIFPGLYVISAGTRVSAPADLLGGEKLQSFLEAERNQFDVILLDTPPIIPVADTINIRNFIDSFIFIYRAGFTPYPLFRKAVEEIGEEHILGVILNGVAHQKQRYYQRYYGKYYRKTGSTESTESAELPESLT